MPARQKSDRPLSCQDFEVGFLGDAARARFLVERRWPEGLVRPACGGRKGWEPDRDRPGRECGGCRRQTPVTAATILQSGHLPLTAWFPAAHLLAFHFNGLSALPLQAQPGIGSCKTARLLLIRLRRAMADPDRSLLQTLVGIGGTEMPFRSNRDPAGGRKGGRSPVGKIVIVGAVERSAQNEPPPYPSGADPRRLVEDPA